MTFRDRLFATVAAARAVIEEPGVLIVGSEVPNFLEPGSASTLVVSQDLVRPEVNALLHRLEPMEKS